jgi:polyisoprenoid-binding protein YceI
MQTWNLDTDHSHVEFAVRHLGISTVKGRFKTFAGQAATDADGHLTAFNAEINVASIDTGSEQRDGHLRSGDFFETEQFPAMTFASTAITPLGGREYKAEGHLTIKGVTKPVTLTVELAEPAKDPWGNTKIAAEAKGKLVRSEFGLTWNAALETGGVLVSDEVKLSFDVQAALAAA